MTIFHVFFVFEIHKKKEREKISSEMDDWSHYQSMAGRGRNKKGGEIVGWSIPQKSFSLSCYDGCAKNVQPLEVLLFNESIVDGAGLHSTQGEHPSCYGRSLITGGTSCGFNFNGRSVRFSTIFVLSSLLVCFLRWFVKWKPCWALMAMTMMISWWWTGILL